MCKALGKVLSDRAERLGQSQTFAHHAAAPDSVLSATQTAASTRTSAWAVRAKSRTLNRAAAETERRNAPAVGSRDPGSGTLLTMGDGAVMGDLREFVAERDWGQFHTAENLAKSISVEAAELLECFQWSEPGDFAEVRDELADVLTYCYLLADRLNLDPEEIMLSKLRATRAKYPVEKARGRSTKYDRL